MLDDWKECIFFVAGGPLKETFETVIQAQFLIYINHRTNCEQEGIISTLMYLHLYAVKILSLVS